MKPEKSSLKLASVVDSHFLSSRTVSHENSWHLDRVATGHCFSPQAGQKSGWERLFAHWQDLWWYL